MNNKTIKAVKIKPTQAPEIITLSAGYKGFFEIIDEVNKDISGNVMSIRKGFDVIQITKALHVFTREDAEEDCLGLNRMIGHVPFYGTMILANMDNADELTTMDDVEAGHFCYIFKEKEIPISMFPNAVDN